MLCEFSNNEVQTINPGETVIFDTTEIPCKKSLVLHRDGTGIFMLKGIVRNGIGCSCCNPKTANYLIEFGANIAIPTGGTVGPISVAVAVNGSTIPSSQMISTPAAVEEYNNVSVAKTADIFAGCCETVSIRNISDQPILMQNANIIISRPDLYVSY